METLSDNRMLSNEMVDVGMIYYECDIKQFIKDLKEELRKAGLTNCSLKIVDKLAGEKLI